MTYNLRRFRRGSIAEDFDYEFPLPIDELPFTPKPDNPTFEDIMLQSEIEQVKIDIQTKSRRGNGRSRLSHKSPTKQYQSRGKPLPE